MKKKLKIEREYAKKGIKIDKLFFALATKSKIDLFEKPSPSSGEIKWIKTTFGELEKLISSLDLPRELAEYRALERKWAQDHIPIINLVTRLLETELEYEKEVIRLMSDERTSMQDVKEGVIRAYKNYCMKRVQVDPEGTRDATCGGSLHDLFATVDELLSLQRSLGVPSVSARVPSYMRKMYLKRILRHKVRTEAYLSGWKRTKDAFTAYLSRLEEK